ncbi:hypothetical protein RD792_004297 [Penstemon davidsonii]|uniref:SBP-type domain-containing protein n=1 Tax=Penstemon davidsonii TaxID=160366 RepID=A0ABR0DI78_9LAMI|nr:hypothetical protein RD792_004297 [Penstemon davidsonii]
MEHYWTLVNNNNSNNFTTTSTSNSVQGHYGNCNNNSNSESAFHALMLGKRSRSSPPECQVEGCEVVLGINNAKEYHRRHKVCEVHAKAPRVVVHGIQQRFCQQCSRFHGVEEFDEAKRSCRRRLAGHNERRRKQLSSQYHNHSLNPRKPGKHSSSSECALSLLSSSTNNHNYYPNWCNIKLTPSPSPLPAADLPARCSAALRELIAENRASNLASRQLINTNRPVAEDFYGGSNHQLAFIEHGTGNRVGRELDFGTDQGSEFGS